MTRAKRLLKLIASCCLYSLVVLLIDTAAIFLLTVQPTSIVPTLSLLVLLEGGIGLIVGSAVALYTPVIRKVEETLFHSEPWDAARQKHAEKQSYPWIVTGIILVSAALIISAF